MAKVRIHMPEVLRWQRERLVAKLEEAEVQLENNRLEQELVLMAQRLTLPKSWTVWKHTLKRPTTF